MFKDMKAYAHLKPGQKGTMRLQKALQTAVTCRAKGCRIAFLVVFVALHLVAASQLYLLSKDILYGDRSASLLAIPLRYPAMQVPATPLTVKFTAQQRLCADFAQVYFPSQNPSALRDAYSTETTLDPWHRPSRYPPLLHLLCSQTLSRLDYGVACLIHLAVQVVLLWASFAYVFFRFGLRKYLLPALLLINVCLFLTPVGLSWLERGQFSLYVALCYLWMTLAVATGERRCAMLGALFGFVKWTAFPFIFVVLMVCLLQKESRLEFKERLFLSATCGGTILLLFFSLPVDGIFFLKGLLGQELTLTPSGLTLLMILPKVAVKTMPLFLVSVGCAIGVASRLQVRYLIPFFAGAAVILTMYPTLAYDYSVPCLTAFIPCMAYWAHLPGIDRFLGVSTQSLFVLFLLVSSYAYGVLEWSELSIILFYLIVAISLILASVNKIRLFR